MADAGERYVRVKKDTLFEGTSACSLFVVEVVNRRSVSCRPRIFTRPRVIDRVSSNVA